MATKKTGNNTPVKQNTDKLGNLRGPLGGKTDAKRAPAKVKKS